MPIGHLNYIYSSITSIKIKKKTVFALNKNLKKNFSDRYSKTRIEMSFLRLLRRNFYLITRCNKQTVKFERIPSNTFF